MFGYKLGGSSALAVIVAFFAPWLMFSCGAQPIGEFSGYDFASGRVFSQVAQAQQFNVSENSLASLWLVPLAAIVVLVVAGIALMRAYAFINSRIDALLMVVGGAVQLFFTYTKMSAISSKVNMNPTDLAIAGSLINIEWRYGLFVTIIGAIIIIVGGFMVFQEDSY